MAKYRGTFNWYGQVFEIYTQASSERAAFYLFCIQIGKKVICLPSRTKKYFCGSNRYEIKEIN
jgi:hypothetical protein